MLAVIAAAYAQMGEQPGCSIGTPGFCQLTAITGGGPITTPVIAYSNNVTAPSNAANNFGPIVGGITTIFNTPATARESIMPIPGNFNNLYVLPNVTVTSGTWVVALSKSGTAQTLTCSLVATTSTACTDTNAAHNVTVSPGDSVGWITQPSGTPTSTPLIISAYFTASNSGESFLAGSSIAANTTSPSVLVPQGFSNSIALTDPAAQAVMPVSGQLDNLYVATGAAPGAGKSYTIYISKNGADASSTVSCQITGAATTTCNSPAQATNTPISVVAGDLIAIYVSPSGTPTATNIRFGMRWRPTVAGQSLMLMTDVSAMPNTGANRFTAANGPSTAIATESSNNNYGGPTGFHVSNLWAQVSTDPGNAKSYATTFRTSNSTSTALTCTITGNGSSITHCQDTNAGHSVAVTSGTPIDWQVAPSGTPNATTTYTIGATMTVP